MIINKVKMLGYFTVYACNNKVINITSPKAIALLAYLIFYRNTSISRDKLAGLLWDDCDNQHARGSLRQLLLRLKQQLPKHCLELSYHYIVLDTGNLEIDIDHFQEFSQSNDIQLLECAIDLYQGSLIQDFSSISIEFDTWLALKRIELHESMRSLTNKLLKHYLLHDMKQKALSLAQFTLSLDELNEDIHYLIMQIYTQQNRRIDAILQYKNCKQILNNELNIKPSSKLSKLYQTIKVPA